jgi:NADH dehydrogenase
VILLVGGTGRLGAALVRRRAGGDEPIRVLTRDRWRAAHLGDGVAVAVGDIREPATLVDAFKGVRLVVAAAHGLIGPKGVSPRSVDLDGNVNLLRAAETAGARVVLLSVVGAAADHPSELFRMKSAAEQRTQASCVPATIVRATAFTELWIELLRDTAGRSGRPLIFGRGTNPINFVAVDDVAHLVDLVVDDTSAGGTTLEIGGRDNLTFKEFTAVLRDAEPALGRPRHLPPAILRLTAATAGRLKPQLGRQIDLAIAMDRLDLRFDGGSARSRYPHLSCTPVTESVHACMRLSP